MTDKPLVSILIPIYGVEKFIERCAISLFEQSYQNIEFIFVNDCTKDNSINILNDVIARYPERKSFVKIITHEKNKGLAGARNTALDNALGDFVMHIDSDDYVNKDLVTLAVSKQIATGADIVLTDFIQAYPTFTVSIKHPIYNDSRMYCVSAIKREMPVTIWGKLIRRNIYTSNNIHCSEGNNQGEDYQVLPILCYYVNKVACVDQCLYYYDCQNEGAYSNSFTLAKHSQNWHSMDIVKDFFSNKDKVFMDAVKCGRIRQLTDDLIISCKSKGVVAEKYYTNAIQMLAEIDKRYWKEVPLEKRIILSLSSHFLLMKSYTLSMRMTRHIFLSLYSKMK